VLVERHYERILVERKAFARARQYFRYSPAATWLAHVAAVGSGALYVCLLVILGLFADLVVFRGEIPSLRDLSVRDQQAYLDDWQELPPAERDAKLRQFKVDNGQIDKLRKKDVHQASVQEREIAWRAHVYEILNDRVGPEAADLIVFLSPDQPMADCGILSLVVRSKGRIYGSLVDRIARARPQMWQVRLGQWPNYYYYLLDLLILACGTAVMRALLRFLMINMAARAATEAATRLRRAVYHQTFRLGTLAIRALGPSEAVGIFTRELEAVHNGLYAWVTVVFREPIKFALVLAFALVVNFWLALAFLLFATVVWLVGGQVAAHYRREGRITMARAAEQLALIQESLMLMRLVKIYLMELFNQTRVERQLARYEKAQLRRYFGEAIYRPLLSLLATLATAILLGTVGLVVLNRQLSTATAITLAAALGSLYNPFTLWLEQRRTLRRARKSAVALFEFLDRRGEVGQVVGAEFLPPLSKRLEFDDVSLREPGTSHLLLDRISLTVPAGQHVALVGPDDLEKHALVYLIARFLDPSTGEIRIDDHNLRWVTLDSLRAQTAMVVQHNLIFNDTVANNIGCGDQSYTLPQIIEAAKVAHAHQFIQKLPHGYETVIGEMGHHLGVGEQFLIALARAILRDPPLLIIEEPAVPLTEDMKALLDDTFARILPERTAIFLAHRASTIRACDQVFLLHKGRVHASGPHRELLTQNDLYRHLHYIEFHDLVEQV
jgi:ATP-binding cassette subfamily B protein